MIKYCLILLMAMGLAVNSFAHPYPITPRPLRLLVEESQYIIVGYVVKVSDAAAGSKNDHWGGTVAKIAIKERLQGQLQQDTLQIAFEPYMICPSPPVYEDDTYVIAFVDKDKDGRYYTHALSYGAKTLTLPDIAIYKTRILEMQAIIQLKDEKERYTQTVEWLVKCAEQPATRWEGSFELGLRSDFMVYYDKRYPNGFRKGLSEAQRERLKTALLATVDIQDIDFGLVDLVYVGNESLIDVFLLNALKRQQPTGWLVGSFMRKLRHLNNAPAMDKLMARFDKIQFEPNKEAEIKNCVAEFIQLVEQGVVNNS